MSVKKTLGIKAYNIMMGHLTRKKIPQTAIKTADEVKQPPVKEEISDREAFNAFMKRNPQADGGRIGFFEGKLVKIKTGPQKGKIKVRSMGERLPGGGKAPKYFNNVDEAKAAIKEYRDKEGRAVKELKKSFSGVTKKQEDIAKKVYGKTMKELYDTNRNIFFNIKRGFVKETTEAGKGAKVEGNISVKTQDIKQPDGSIKKIETGVKYPNKEVEKKFKKSVKDIFKKPQGTVPFTTLAKDFPITERQARRAAKIVGKEEGLKFAKGRTSQEYIKEVRNPLLDKTTSRKVEKRMALERAKFLRDKPEVFGKIDTAHRASKSHMARLGLQFDTQLVGMDSRLINQVVLKPAENMLDKLYERRENILDNIKDKPTDEQKKILKEINDSVKKVVKTTSGRFVGIIVDPNTLEPSFSGIKKNLAFSKVNKTIKEIEKLPGAPDSRGGGARAKDSEYFKFIKDNVQKSVSGEIKRGFVPNDFKVILSDPKNRKNLLDYARKNAPDILPQFKKVLDNPTSKQSLALFANPFFNPGVLAEAFKTIPTPLGAVGLTAGFGVDPTSAIDRASIAAEAAFAPQLVKQAAKMGAAQRLFNLGLTPAMAARVARIASPLGIASLGAEGLYQAGKFTKKRIGELKAMTPEQRQNLRAQQEALAFEGARDGGLIGDKSGPAPESGPQPQGLPGIYKRGKKL
jgi:hypothetical protein